MALKNKIKELEVFIVAEVDFFEKLLKGMDRDTYTRDPILRRAVDKSLNDIILATVDIAMNLLRIKKRMVPKTYKDIILATYEFVGDLATKIALLTKCRNETIHGYLKIN